MYGALKKYQEKEGHCRVLQSYINESDLPAGLWGWVSQQRLMLEKRLKKTGDLICTERRAKLNAIGFDWSVAHAPQDDWDAMFESLK